NLSIGLSSTAREGPGADDIIRAPVRDNHEPSESDRDRRRPRRQRSRLAGGAPGGVRRSLRDAAGAHLAGPQDDLARRAGLLELPQVEPARLGLGPPQGG